MRPRLRFWLLLVRQGWEAIGKLNDHLGRALLAISVLAILGIFGILGSFGTKIHDWQPPWQLLWVAVGAAVLWFLLEGAYGAAQESAPPALTHQQIAQTAVGQVGQAAGHLLPGQPFTLETLVSPTGSVRTTLTASGTA